MFHKLFERAHALNRYLSAPLYENRLKYLAHCAEQGTAHVTLRRIAMYQLIVIEHLQLTSERIVTLNEVEAAANLWGQKQSQRIFKNHNIMFSRSRWRFLCDAKKWLQFSGLLIPPQKPQLPYQLSEYVSYQRRERGLSEATIEGQYKIMQKYFGLMKSRRLPLARITILQVDNLLMNELNGGKYSRNSIQNHAGALRLFFRYAQDRGWCRPGIAEGIRLPRVYKHATLPSSPTWKEVRALISTTRGNSKSDIRSRALLLLLAMYGVRRSEALRLCLDDFNWEAETLTIRRSKRGPTQIFPLDQAVGQAVIRYIKEVRPQSQYRELFLNLRAPIRPMHCGSLTSLVMRR